MSNIVNQLQNMENKTWQYGGHIHYIKKTSVDAGEGKIKIVTNLQEYTRPLDAAPTFIKQFAEIKQVEGLLPTNNEVVLHQQFEQENNITNDLIAILKTNIEKVKENAAYIPQAISVNENVKTIIDIAKVKLELRRTFMQASRR